MYKRLKEILDVFFMTSFYGFSSKRRIVCTQIKLKTKKKTASSDSLLIYSGF